MKKRKGGGGGGGGGGGTSRPRLLGLCPPSGEPGKDRYSRQDQRAAPDGIPQVRRKGVVQQHSRNNHEQSRNHGVSPGAIGPRRIRLFPAQHEDRAGCRSE